MELEERLLKLEEHLLENNHIRIDTKNPVHNATVRWVYQGEKEDSEIDVAVKVFQIPVERGDQRDHYMADVRREIKIYENISRKQNPHIVPCLGGLVLEKLDFAYIVMNWMPESLQQRLQTGNLTVEESIEYTIQILEGLAFIHGQTNGPGIYVHGDPKPSNIYIDDGLIKLGDFGHSRIVLPIGESSHGRFIGEIQTRADQRYEPPWDTKRAEAKPPLAYLPRVESDIWRTAEVFVEMLGIMKGREPNWQRVPEIYRSDLESLKKDLLGADEPEQMMPNAEFQSRLRYIKNIPTVIDATETVNGIVSSPADAWLSPEQIRQLYSQRDQVGSLIGAEHAKTQGLTAMIDERRSADTALLTSKLQYWQGEPKEATTDIATIDGTLAQITEAMEVNKAWQH